jgi:high-affinity iron transporter
VLDSGLQIVLQGLALGSILLGIIGFVIFYLQKRIPYLPLLVATGLLMVLILVMMTGQTVHTMQAVGWINISPIANIQIPYWVGLWFGIYATWQTILAQVFVVVIVGGSYLAAEYIKKLKGLKTQSLTKKLGF